MDRQPIDQKQQEKDAKQQISKIERLKMGGKIATDFVDNATKNPSMLYIFLLFFSGIFLGVQLGRMSPDAILSVENSEHLFLLIREFSMVAFNAIISIFFVFLVRNNPGSSKELKDSLTETKVFKLIEKMQGNPKS